MTGNYLNKLLSINAKHALYRKDGYWYHNLKKFPGVLFDENGYLFFADQESYVNNPSLQIKKDLHVLGGIESLPGYREFTDFERELINGIEPSSIKEKEVEETVRVLREIEVVLRNRALVVQLKKLYNNTCQICGTQLSIAQGKFYSEIHHIISLGRPHNGKDMLSNMICVCPNHHVLLDLKAIPIELKIRKHEISQESIDFHNSLVNH